MTPEFPSEKYFGGGIASCLYRVCTRLHEQGHDIHVIVPANHTADLLFEGMHLHRLAPGRMSGIMNRLTFGGLWQTTQRLEFSWRAYRKVKELHRRQPLDVVQFTSYRMTGFVTSFFPHLPAVTFVASYTPAVNKLAGVRRNLDVRCLEWMEKRQIRQFRRVHAPSFLIKGLLEKDLNVRDAVVIRTPFFQEMEAPDESVYAAQLKNKSYLLYFGRLQMHKGFHILAQALPAVFRALPDCCAVFVGADRPSPLGPSMAQYARHQCTEFADRLIWIDEVPHAQLYPIVAHAKLVVLPSLIDNLPNTLLEAISFGRPVLGTYGASFDEILTDGENGFLVPPGDPKALADKIVEAWKHPRLEVIGKAAAKKATEFAPERTVTELVRYYEDVVIGH